MDRRKFFGSAIGALAVLPGLGWLKPVVGVKGDLCQSVSDLRKYGMCLLWQVPNVFGTKTLEVRSLPLSKAIPLVASQQFPYGAYKILSGLSGSQCSSVLAESVVPAEWVAHIGLPQRQLNSMTDYELLDFVTEKAESLCHQKAV